MTSRILTATVGAETSFKERLLYIDNLRLMVIALVIVHHLGVTYSGIGSWYYYERVSLDGISTVWFAFLLSFDQAYFMGLLFMVAGYFVPGGYDRKGLTKFAKDRFRRLAIPTLIFMIAIDPFISLVELGNKPTGFSITDFLSSTGPMWFAAALFIFSLTYASARRTFLKPISYTGRKQFNLTLPRIIGLILIISVSAFLIRIVQPIGTNILNMQLGFFASYIALFILGIIAYRSNLFTRISYRTGKTCLIATFAIGVPAWLFILGLAAQSGNINALFGGLTWQSGAYSLWESFTAIAMSIGLIGVFREKFNHQSKLIKRLSDNSFAVYMFHPMIIVPVTLLFSPLSLYPIAKWLMLCIICVPLCFGATNFVFRRIPLLKNVL